MVMCYDKHSREGLSSLLMGMFETVVHHQSMKTRSGDLDRLATKHQWMIPCAPQVLHFALRGAFNPPARRSGTGKNPPLLESFRGDVVQETLHFGGV